MTDALVLKLRGGVGYTTPPVIRPLRVTASKMKAGGTSAGHTAPQSWEEFFLLREYLEEIKLHPEIKKIHK